ncbi:DUF1367 family protein [Pseudoalteromonas umbrosa]|uniref:DUF1367 family protein n=1 Tax=Pseudoalteromonas umbrosa TaxID=3048489 RepID=UPI0024C39F3A|nr:DUF1367 family protein [Pseudoalteromonas sp. B95]MDK1289801.1 DUF1367 family protein [Pseudoalteromonas sp. B95]
MQLQLARTTNALIPADEQSREALKGIALGKTVQAKITQPRNCKFHRKYMALLNLAYDHFEPKPVEYKGRMITPGKNFDEFRKWVAICAGHYEFVAFPGEEFRVRAKSIAFSKLSEDEFQKLYSRSIDALLKNLLSSYRNYQEVEDTVNQIVREFG